MGLHYDCYFGLRPCKLLGYDSGMYTDERHGVFSYDCGLKDRFDKPRSGALCARSHVCVTEMPLLHQLRLVTGLYQYLCTVVDPSARHLVRSEGCL